MATPPVPPKPATSSRPTQGSVDPKQNPPGAVTITGAPPLPVEQPTAGQEQKPVMEAGDAEQEAGKTAMDQWKKRQAAEEEAGKAAVARYASLKPVTPPVSE